MDVRMILERLARVLEQELHLRIERGWIAVDRQIDDNALAATIQRALEWGVYERERYAFFSTIGHELRTPLTAIRGYLETLSDTTLSDELRQRFIAIAHAESLRVNRLLDGMFDISMLDLHCDTQLSDQCESNDALQAAFEAVSATPPGQLARIEYISSQPAIIGLGFDRLVQIIVNLLSNALKFGPSHPWIRLHGIIEQGRVLNITVEDNGPGVPEADHDRIFRLGERATTQIPGSGIGLALVRLYAERAGGCVGIRASTLGGSCFWIRLPIIQPD